MYSINKIHYTCRYYTKDVDEKLEIWSKERWEEFIANNEENLSDIADSLFTSNYYG